MAEFPLSGPLAIIGHPVGHSLSPRIHNAALQALGHPPVYELRDTPPDRLSDTVRALCDEGFSGFNVTLPHKEHVITLLDRVDPVARRVGAVNTVAIERHGHTAQATGFNTDVDGFLEPLDTFSTRLRGGRVLVWGAGGAARAVVAGLVAAHDPGVITVVARRAEAVRAMADDFGADGRRIVAASWPADAHMIEAHDLLVNTTPLGMHPHVDGTPAMDGTVLRPGQVVYDLVYNPTETRLLRDARLAGADTIGGLPMLVGQAAAAFRLWTGRAMPLDAVREALNLDDSDS